MKSVQSLGPIVLTVFVGTFVLFGCSQKNVKSTTADGVATTMKSGDGESAGGFRGQDNISGENGSLSANGGQGVETPRADMLQGFSKTPKAEVVSNPPPVMMVKATQEAPSRKAASHTLADIYFAFDKWALSDEGKKNLAESAEFLRQHPQAKLLIEGDCDERGSREYNLVLGEKRAKETRQYLSDQGLRNPVSVISYGKERPVCTERDEACYAKNRRAHLVVEDAP